jgi:hypothetical protein
MNARERLRREKITDLSGIYNVPAGFVANREIWLSDVDPK